MGFVAVCGRKVCVSVCVKAEGWTKKKEKGCQDGRIGQAQTEKARECKKREGRAKTEKRQEQSKDEEASMEY